MTSRTDGGLPILICGARDWKPGNLRNAGTRVGFTVSSALTGPVAATACNDRSFEPGDEVFTELRTLRLSSDLIELLHKLRIDPAVCVDLAIHDPENAYEYLTIGLGSGIYWRDNLLGKAKPKRLRLPLVSGVSTIDRAPEYISIAARLKAADRGSTKPLLVGDVTLVRTDNDDPLGSFGSWRVTPTIVASALNPEPGSGWGPGLCHSLRVENQCAGNIRVGPTGFVSQTTGERLVPGAVRTFERIRTTSGLSVCAEAVLADPATEAVHCTWSS